jgi:hypothetical protein
MSQGDERQRRNLELYKNLFLEALLNDGQVSDEEEQPLADFARAVGLSDQAVAQLRAEVTAEPRVAAQVAELLRGVEEDSEPPDGIPDEEPSFADPDGPGWESDESEPPPDPNDPALSGRRSRLKALRTIAKEAGSRLSETGASCRVARCNAEDPDVQERLRQAAAGEIQIEFAPLTIGLGGLAAVWPEAGRNLLREVKAVAGWRLAFIPHYVTPDRKLEVVQHKQGWLYFRAGQRQGIYVRFGSLRGSQVSVFVGFGSEQEREDPDYCAARERIVAGCDLAIGEGWSLQQAPGQLRLEAKRTLSCEAMTEPGTVLSVADALQRLSTYVVQHLAGCMARES